MVPHRAQSFAVGIHCIGKDYTEEAAFEIGLSGAGHLSHAGLVHLDHATIGIMQEHLIPAGNRPSAIIGIADA